MNSVNRNCKFTLFFAEKIARCFISVEFLGADSKLKCLGLKIFQASAQLSSVSKAKSFVSISKKVLTTLLMEGDHKWRAHGER
jgi:hypothetical protein